MKENFQSKEFLQKWNDIEKPKKKSEKREWSKVPKWHKWYKLTQVEEVEQVEAGLQNYVEQVEQEQGGLQIPWNKWNKDKGSVQMNLSTWPNVELQGRETLFSRKRKKPKGRWGIYESSPQPITRNKVVDK